MQIMKAIKCVLSYRFFYGVCVCAEEKKNGLECKEIKKKQNQGKKPRKWN